MINSKQSAGRSTRIRISKRICAAFLLAGLGAALTPSSMALGVRIPNQDPAAIARGNAFAATADNPSALYYNPAGITQLEGENFQFGVLNYFGINTDFESTTGATTKSRFEILPVPELYLTCSPKDSSLSYGLGIYAPFGLGVRWPEDTPFRQQSIESRLTYVTLAPIVAWQPHRTFSVAVGPAFHYSRIKLHSGLLSPVPIPSDDFLFKGDDFAFGFNAGLLWQPHPKWSFGANYRSAATMDYQGTTKIESPVPVLASGSADTTARVEFPQMVSAGISFRPTPRWNFEFDVDYTDWNTLNSVTFKGSSALFGADVVLPLNWRGSWFYEFGATHYLNDKWFVSAGYFFSSQSTSTANFTPAVPDTDLHVGSIGVGYRGKKWDWTAASQLIAGPWREVRTSPPSAADGRYRLFVPTLAVSVGYHF